MRPNSSHDTPLRWGKSGSARVPSRRFHHIGLLDVPNGSSRFGDIEASRRNGSRSSSAFVFPDSLRPRRMRRPAWKWNSCWAYCQRSTIPALVGCHAGVVAAGIDLVGRSSSVTWAPPHRRCRSSGSPVRQSRRHRRPASRGTARRPAWPPIHQACVVRDGGPRGTPSRARPGPCLGRCRGPSRGTSCPSAAGGPR